MTKNFLSYLLLAAGISFLISFAGSQSAGATDNSPPTDTQALQESK